MRGSKRPGIVVEVEELSQRRPRAVGHRIGYLGVPAFVREWVDSQFGPARVTREHVGGMSAGCASSLVTADGQGLFVKAVGVGLNEQTVALFRHEVGLLHVLEPAPYRPAVRAVFDRDGWVAIVLDHVEGRFPDLAADGDFTAVTQAVAAQVAELTPPPKAADALRLATTAERWVGRWTDLQTCPERCLPGWAAARFDDLMDRVRALPHQLPAATLCHFDIRDDNLLVREDGQAVVVDWGMARLGPAWTDLVLLAAQKPTAGQAQRWIEQWVEPADQDVVTSFLVAFGGSQAWNAHQPAKPSLPTFAAYAREDMRRLLALARLRLNL
jgi:hypothetical protein